MKGSPHTINPQMEKQSYQIFMTNETKAKLQSSRPIASWTAVNKKTDSKKPDWFVGGMWKKDHQKVTWEARGKAGTINKHLAAHKDQREGQREGKTSRRGVPHQSGSRFSSAYSVELPQPPGKAKG